MRHGLNVGKERIEVAEIALIPIRFLLRNRIRMLNHFFMNLAGTRNETNYDTPQMLATVTRISKGKKTAISHFFFNNKMS